MHYLTKLPVNRYITARLVHYTDKTGDGGYLNMDLFKNYIIKPSEIKKKPNVIGT